MSWIKDSLTDVYFHLSSESTFHFEARFSKPRAHDPVKRSIMASRNFAALNAYIFSFMWRTMEDPVDLRALGCHSTPVQKRDSFSSYSTIDSVVFPFRFCASLNGIRHASLTRLWSRSVFRSWNTVFEFQLNLLVIIFILYCLSKEL